MNKKLVCEECGSTEEVLEFDEWWTAWGRSCWVISWSKNEGSKKLCDNCEDENWEVCEDCGALIEKEHYGADYPEDYDGDILCPECLQEYFKEKRIERRKVKASRNPFFIRSQISTEQPNMEENHENI